MGKRARRRGAEPRSPEAVEFEKIVAHWRGKLRVLERQAERAARDPAVSRESYQRGARGVVRLRALLAGLDAAYLDVVGGMEPEEAMRLHGLEGLDAAG